MDSLGGMIAERLNEATEVAVLSPLRGFSCWGQGGALHDPVGDACWSDVEGELRSGIELERVDTDVNDRGFAAAVARASSS